MLGGRTPYDLIAARPAGDFTNLKLYVEQLGKAGIPLVFLAPGTKDQPIDLRTPADARTDNTAAQEAAKAAGDARWAEVKTHAGIKIATADPKRLGKYVTAAAKRYPNQQPNIAMLVHNMLVVDCDWAEGVEAFRAAYLAATGEDISPTVLTPGVYRDGEWKHFGGGHFYFDLPDGWTMPEHADRVELWEGTAKTSLFVAKQYVLIPPSVRPEGPYQWVGEVRTAPTALLQLIEQRAAEVAQAQVDRAVKAALRAANGPSAIDGWAADVDWAELLEPDGWYFTGSRTACGCPEVTAPGVHASPKSATAHEVGCRETDTSSGHGPLHVWTDNPPAEIVAYTKATGATTMTKLQYVSWTRHGGDDAAAVAELGIGGGGMGFASAAELLDAAGVIETPIVLPTPAPTPAPAPSATTSVPVALATPTVSAPTVSASPPAPMQSTMPPSPQPDATELPEVFRRKGFDPNNTVLYPKGFPSDPELLSRVFDHCDICRVIFHAARNRRPKAAHPMAVLHREMLRRGMRAPVTLRLWESTPLSTYVVVVGRSGTGKSIAAMPDSTPWQTIEAPAWLAEMAAKNIDAEEDNKGKGKDDDTEPAVPFGMSSTPTLIPFNFDASISLGSGQVLSDSLIVKCGKGKDQWTEMVPHPAMILDEDELTTMLSAAKNESATIISTLNAAWAGRPIGNKTRTYGDNRTVGPYNLFSWGGLQPKLAHEYLRHDDSGYPQRGVFTAVTDPYRLVNEPQLAVPSVTPSGAMPHITPTDRFTADQAVLDELDAANEDADFDHLPDEEDEKRSHSMQVRVRIACLGALLHGTLHISTDLWDWTAGIMEHSTRTHAWVEAEVAGNRTAENVKVGEDRSTVAAAQDAHTAECVNETAAAALSLINGAGQDGITAGKVKSNLAAGKKPWLDKALAHLVKEKLIYLDGTRYKRPIIVPGVA